ncbi:MAG: DUF4342 domain-containing protein [Firmicutes bacterium]|nr:DUF4342 domain-containing protein [Bacillota bacterium]MDY2919934.1 DUF4342 domain-containing protein [Lentihominibacter sp.]
MEITLEKIELVKDRTGVTYAEAKKALEEADGSVVDAIIAIEETVNAGSKGRGFGERGQALFSSLKNLIKKGNVSKIHVKRDSELILNVPVNAGIVGICIAPLASVVAIVAAFGFKCTVEVVKDDGTIIDVSDAVSDTIQTAVEKGNDAAESIKNTSIKYYEKAKDSDALEKAVNKGKEYINKAKESELADKARDKVEIIKDKASDAEIVGKAKEVVSETAEAIKNKAEEVVEKVRPDVSDIDMSDLAEEILEEEENIEVEVEVEPEEKAEEDEK